ncbi:MAG: hypothetical protein A2854_04645 [Parcubacteria group bacterium RIFCSPHIGHO2_01_FULL_56_18]|nr:MAG: hypothetical protein A2854_04645 [Parcubacteria group bacterium RIFCSPHIGHO2_01_FULL_56_18]
MKLKLLYVFSRATRAEQMRMIAGSRAADDLLYGYRAFDRQRFQVDFICRYQDEWSLARRLWFPIEYVIARVVGMGFALTTVLEQYRQLRAADAIISTVDTVGLPLAMLKALRLLPGKLIYISQGLSDRLEVAGESVWRSGLIRLYRWFLWASDVILVLGEGAIEPLRQQLHLPVGKIQAIAFGVDKDFWTPGKALRGDYVLSVGSDAARDYETLLQATKGMQVKIITRLPARSRQGVTRSSEHTDAELRDFYRQAAVIVIPLKDVAQPSGQSATMQAMACGRAVILTRTRGLWEPAVMRHKNNCYLVEPGDVAGLRAGIEWLINHPREANTIAERARQTVEKRYNSVQIAKVLESYVYAALPRY